MSQLLLNNPTCHNDHNKLCSFFTYWLITETITNCAKIYIPPHYRYYFQSCNEIQISCIFQVPVNLCSNPGNEHTMKCSRILLETYWHYGTLDSTIVAYKFSKHLNLCQHYLTCTLLKILTLSKSARNSSISSGALEAIFRYVISSSILQKMPVPANTVYKTVAYKFLFLFLCLVFGFWQVYKMSSAKYITCWEDWTKWVRDIGKSWHVNNSWLYRAITMPKDVVGNLKKSGIALAWDCQYIVQFSIL